MLSNHHTQSETHDINRLHTECTAESNATRRHLHDRVRRFSSRSRNARIVKQNDLMIRCETVRYRRIPTVQVGVEIFQKEQRNRSWLAETTVGITNSLGLNKLGRRCLMRMVSHFCTPSISVCGTNVSLTTCWLHRREGRNFQSPVLVSMSGRTLCPSCTNSRCPFRASRQPS